MIKQLAISLLLLTNASIGLAGTFTIKPLSGDLISWKLQRDSLIVLEILKYSELIRVSVDKTVTHNGIPVQADQVILNCNGVESSIAPGSTKSCKLMGKQYARLFIADKDYHNGATGVISAEIIQ